MFTDPQSVTVNAVPISLPKVGSAGERGSVYENLTDGVQLKITHVIGKRNRHTVRFDFTKTAADPLLDGVSRQYSMSAYLVIDRPAVGFSSTEAEQNAQAAVDYLDTPGTLTKVIGSQS